ncbi:MAG: response regulator [Myxococcales bacterium]|nr:response regulator [Myxococcales bacterium]USN51760.1 MAG: response regulator [Myxococcales bacterium]
MWKVDSYINNKFKPRVLICDQEPHLRMTLFEYLISVGFHAEQARNGHECIDLACDTHPDVILLDLELPYIDGQTTIHHLRRLGINVPVLLFSSNNSTIIPFDNDSAVLKKPFKPKEIALVLETLLLETKKEKHFIPRRFKIQ